jgi:hypothetical protein
MVPPLWLSSGGWPILSDPIKLGLPHPSRVLCGRVGLHGPRRHLSLPPLFRFGSQGRGLSHLRIHDPDRSYNAALALSTRSVKINSRKHLIRTRNSSPDFSTASPQKIPSVCDEQPLLRNQKREDSSHAAHPSPDSSAGPSPALARTRLQRNDRPSRPSTPTVLTREHLH